MVTARRFYRCMDTKIEVYAIAFFGLQNLMGTTLKDVASELPDNRILQ